MGARHNWVRKLITDFETNPDVQIKFHLCAMIFWELNAVAGTLLLFLAPRLWTAIGVFYVFLLSIYANWDTDFDAVSAGQAFKHAKAADEHMESRPDETR